MKLGLPGMVAALSLGLAACGGGGGGGGPASGDPGGNGGDGGATPAGTTEVVVETAQATEIAAKSVVSGGTVTAPPEAKVLSRGVCRNGTGGPRLGGDGSVCSEAGSGAGQFSVTLAGLQAATAYCTAAYAVVEGRTEPVTGKDVCFVTLSAEGKKIEKPTVVHVALGTVGDKTAVAGGNVTADGGAAVTARGVCFSREEATVEQNCPKISTGGTGSFSVTLTGLASGTNYYYKPFATNSAGTAYAEPLKFFVTTTPATPPTPTGPTVEASLGTITTERAELGGWVRSEGTSAVTLRGVCWGKAADPRPGTANSNCTPSGTGGGRYSIWTSDTVPDLPNGETYNYQAYAQNAEGLWGFSGVVSFTVPKFDPSVSAVIPEVIEPRLAVLRGAVTRYPGGGIPADYHQLTGNYQVCWSPPEIDPVDGTCSAARVVAESNGIIDLEYTLRGDQLSPGAAYQAAIVAELEGGSMSYGPLMNVPMVMRPTFGRVVDASGFAYGTVRLNGLWWMTANMRTLKDVNGAAIQARPSNQAWSSTTGAAFCGRGNDGMIDGHLYNWPAAQVLCPAGWRLPTNQEFQSLLGYYPAPSDYTAAVWGGNSATRSGFNANGGGARKSNGTFIDTTLVARWWLAGGAALVMAPNGSYQTREINYDDDAWFGSPLTSGFSVRCVAPAQ